MSDSDYIKCKFCKYKVLKSRTYRNGKKRSLESSMEMVIIHTYEKHMDLPEVKAMYEERMDIETI